MKLLPIKSLLVAATLLAVSAVAQASGPTSPWMESGPSAPPPSYNSYATDNPGSGVSPDFYSYSNNFSSSSSSGSSSYRPSSAVSGPDYTPSEASTYMDYNEALALGNSLQRAPSTTLVAKASLGEIARQLRASKTSAVPATRVIRQTNTGALQICNATATSCHTPN